MMNPTPANDGYNRTRVKENDPTSKVLKREYRIRIAYERFCPNATETAETFTRT